MWRARLFSFCWFFCFLGEVRYGREGGRGGLGEGRKERGWRRRHCTLRQQQQQ